jgi:23S rRNA pseudouridine955/2504/2580 synthase
MLRTGEVRVNGGRKKPTYRLSAGDRVRIPPLTRDAPRREPFIGDQVLEVLAHAVIYEDEDLLVLDKPAGLAVHGGSGVAFGVIEAMRRLRGAELELAHRLDRDTSGVLLLAKRRSALRRVQSAIRAGAMEKSYRLIVHGAWPAGLSELRYPLKKTVTGSGERRVRVASDGKASLTLVEPLARGPRASLLAARLVTGRTHQIRVHCAAAGHPLVGDEKYADPDLRALAASCGIGRLCLHARSVRLPWLENALESPEPEDFLDAWTALR